MSAVRTDHTATLLADGKVLVAGGGTAELYDPAAETFSPTGPMNASRSGHRATRLLDGTVLITGGNFSLVPTPASAELYDPGTGTFRPVGTLGDHRVGHTATLLPNGKVLVAGGGTDAQGVPLASLEIYDPATETFAAAGTMTAPRWGHSATLLTSGQVLIAGGFRIVDLRTTVDVGRSDAELCDPAAGTCVATGSMVSEHMVHEATLLPDGQVLITGGQACRYGVRANMYVISVDVAELYEPATGSFVPVSNLSVKRSKHTATLLSDGRVLVAGGAHFFDLDLLEPGAAWDSAELYDPETRTFSPTASSLSIPRVGATATLLPNHQVLIAGGGNGLAELWIAQPRQ